MSLVAKQHRFVRMLSLLYAYADLLGYQLTLGQSERPPELAELYAQQGRGIKNSLHTMRLAQDLNLFRDGVWLSGTEDHRPLGEFWEFIGGTWGGRFGDGNHYSLEHNGVK